MAQLSLSCLGNFQAQLGSEPLTSFRTNKVQALLLYLATEPTAHRRESLMTLLWPGMPEGSARHNLRQILYHLNQAIPELLGQSEGNGDTAVPLFLANRQTIQLNLLAAVIVDVGQFEKLLRQVQVHSHMDLFTCHLCHQTLQQAIALYQGDFLADFYLEDSNEFEEWAEIKRQTYRRQALDALETLTTLAIRQKNYSEAQAFAQRQLEIDNLRESAYRQLMEIHALNGRREQALALYETCHRLLAEEWGMAPTNRTTDIYQKILAGDLRFDIPVSQGVRGYELKEEIGEGAYGTIYRAIQPTVGRDVAVKVIRRRYANDPEFIRRFETEAQTIARLEHPHVVPLYDYWRDPEGAYLVMRLLRGGSLLQSLQAGPWPPAAVIPTLDQLASALTAAHRQGIVHRDIKPANILFDEDNNAYLSDFGIAKDLGHDLQLTGGGGLMGTPDYISPEQLMGELVTAQADQYSLGAMLYELLTGERAFADAPIVLRIQKHLSEPLPLISESRPDTPRQIDEVIQRATAKRPSDRFPDVLALAEAFRQAVHQKSTGRFVPGTAIPLHLEITNPYKGLRAFQQSDANDFYGRESLISQLVSRLAVPLSSGESQTEGRFLAVVGPSGSGKSSVVKAGLVPALRQGALPGSENWFVTEMVPGSQPLKELALALLPIAVDPPPSLITPLQKDEHGLLRTLRRILPSEQGAKLLLVIDQFEELFTLTEDVGQGTHFLNSLLTAITAPHSPLVVVVTLRADFYDRPLQIQPFANLFKQHTELVLPLTQEEFAWAIAEPARQVGVDLEVGLVTVISAEVAEQPGALPLLQYALTELFERREGVILTHAAYEASGGVLGALSRRAEEIYAELDEVAQEAARQLFLRLVTLGEGVEDTRRRVLRSELGAIQTSEVGDHGSLETSEVLDVYGRYRLLTFDRDPTTREPTVEVAHEALLREWGRLRDWLAESRNDVRMQRLLANEAREWAAASRDESYLLHGSQLVQFEGWLSDTNIALTQGEHGFLQASIAAREQSQMAEEGRRQRELETVQQLAETEHRRAEEQAQAAQRLRRRAVYLSVAALIAVALAIAAVLFSRQSAEQAQIAFSRELAAAALLNLGEDPERSILLAMEALSRTHTIQAEEALHQAVQTSRVRQTFVVPDTLVEFGTPWVALSPDGSHIFGSGINGGVMWEIDTGEVLFTQTVRSFYHYPLDYVTVEWINRADFSPDGSLLILPNEEWAGSEPLTGTITILAADTGEELITFPAHSGLVQDVAFNPEGTQFASVGLDSSIKVWDLAATLAAGRGVASATLRCHEEGQIVWSVNYSPDGSLVVTTSDDETVRVWDIAAKQELFAIDVGASDAIFSTDGQYLVVGGNNGTVSVVEAATGELHSSVPAAHGQNLIMTVFSPDGSRLITSSGDATAKIWDFIDGEIGANPLVLAGQGGAVAGVSFTPDGRYVITGSADRTARLWDVSIGGEFGTYAHASFVTDVAFNPDGSRLASASLDGTAKIWDVATQEVLFTLPHDDWAVEVEYHPDGRSLATTSSDGTARIWDGRTGEEILVIPAHELGSGFFRGAKGLAYSPDGKRLVTGGADRVVRIWDAATWESLFTLAGHTNTVNAVAYSPNGRWLVTADADATIKVWDPVNFTELWTLSGDPTTIWRAAFDDAGSRLVVGHDSGQVVIWQFPEGEGSDNAPEITLQLKLNSNVAGLADFSPDGNILAVASVGHTSLREAYSGELLVNLGHGATAAVFSPDGRIVATGGNDGFVRLIAANLDELLALAHLRVTRSLTEAECQQYLHLDACPEEISNQWGGTAVKPTTN